MVRIFPFCGKSWAALRVYLGIPNILFTILGYLAEDYAPHFGDNFCKNGIFVQEVDEMDSKNAKKITWKRYAVSTVKNDAYVEEVSTEKVEKDVIAKMAKLA